MAKKKAATKPRPARSIDKNPRLPRFGATKATGRRSQLERELANAKYDLAHAIQSHQKNLEAERVENGRLMEEIAKLKKETSGPIPMILHCPACGGRHVDRELADKCHATHACQHCGVVWKPAKVDTVGVQFLPGYKDEEPVASGKSVMTPFWGAALAGAAAYVGARYGAKT